MNNTDPIQEDLGLIIAFCMMAGLGIFWQLYDAFSEHTSTELHRLYNQFIVKPSYVVFWSIPLVMAVFIRYKALRLIFMVLGFGLLFLSAYNNLLKGN